ncbi:MAG: homocysteine S-methyltransferase family protein [Lachnospiraceae bacterium]
MKSVVELAKEQFLFIDGGCGTILQSEGLKPGELPEKWNVDQSHIIQKMHYDYLKSGCHVVTANTFGANSLKFKAADGPYTLENLIAKAIENAKLAIQKVEKEEGKQKPHYVALDVGPLGKLLKPLGDLDFEDAVQIFRNTIEIGVKYGADFILIETMNDLYEAKAAVLAAKESCDLPVFLTTAYDATEKLLTGADPKTVVAMAEGLGVDAIGVNCSLGPEQMLGIVKQLVEYASVPVIVSPNAGIPRTEKGQTIYDVDPENFTKTMVQIAKIGARCLGGCCGTTPEHIGTMIQGVSSLQPLPITEKQHTLITSYTHAVEFRNKPILIGERINPTGKKKFKEALRNHDIDYILQEALTQQERKADVLDVNVGLPEIDEVAMMEEIIMELQAVTDLPLQIDTTNPEAMERALRRYNGKAMINSVNGKEEVMEQIFPLAKKYGGLVVALTIDEDGIPTTAEGRLAIVEKIYKRATDYGIKAKDIIIDPLAMSISADPQSAKVTLDSLRFIKERFSGKTSLGVSNISFGLPNRDFINASFFTMAMQNGLNAAIMNPGSGEMMKSYYTYCALSAVDENCSAYIEYATSLPATTMMTVPGAGTAGTNAGNTAGNNMGAEGNSGNGTDTKDPLIHAIVKGLKERAGAITKECLQTKAPIEIIDGQLIPALDIVGKGFENKTVFLPQLLMAAEAAGAAFDVIKADLQQKGTEETKKGKIVLATVKGDIHDIGKNIVKVLLENYGYDVIDLGKDVEPELIADTVEKEQISLVGLSALMTTTVPSMEETIQLLRKRNLPAKVVVGGAVLTQEYADMIGADKYAKDAMETVRYAEEFFAK